MRRLFAAGALIASIFMAPITIAASDCGTWPAWETFRSRFVSADGRVIDPRLPEKLTVSEAQAYAMLFALIGNDRASFDKLLLWTQNNLAQGDLARHLPAWKWGLKPDQSWGVLDPNSASDADVWVAYALIEAARFWSAPGYDALGVRVAENILREEVKTLQGLGPTLIPAPYGFFLAGRYRLNPSYLAPQPLRRLALRQPEEPWNSVLASARRILIQGAPAGIAPDWVLWSQSEGFMPDDELRRIGSYDAIRVYLWIGMLDGADPMRAELLDHYAPIARTLGVDGSPAEKIDSITGQFQGQGPASFSAALLPYLVARGAVSTFMSQHLRLIDLRASDAGIYYDQALRLFGEGWAQQRYRFDAHGQLVPQWLESCRPGPYR